MHQIEYYLSIYIYICHDLFVAPPLLQLSTSQLTPRRFRPAGESDVEEGLPASSVELPAYYAYRPSGFGSLGCFLGCDFGLTMIGLLRSNLLGIIFWFLALYGLTIGLLGTIFGRCCLDDFFKIPLAVLKGLLPRTLQHWGVLKCF